jgi:hypothetical protein
MAGALTLLEDADVKHLPPQAQELVSLIGFSETIRLVELRPGVPVYIPKTLPEDHWLAVELGKKSAEILVKHYGGLTLSVPNCKLALVKIRQRMILKSRQEGHSQTETALLHNVTPRWVSELESREPEEDLNLRLF